jgi:hypothetical protein
MRKFTLIASHAALSLSLFALVACSATNSQANGGSPTPAASAEAVAAVSSPALPPPAVTPPGEAQAHAQEKHPEDDIPRATGPEAKKLSDAKQAVLVDVRSVDAYKSGHAKGALHVNLDDIEKGEHKALPRDKQLITYCT